MTTITTAGLSTVARNGLRRGAVETRIMLTTPGDLVMALGSLAIMVSVLLAAGGGTFAGSDLDLGSMNFPSVLGATLVTGTVPMIAGKLAWSKASGELLRAKAIPRGLGSFLIGHTISVAVFSLFTVVGMVLAGLAFFDGLVLSWTRLGLLAAVTAAAMAALLPLGAVLGGLLSNPRHVGLVQLPLTVLIGISGIFYPLAAYPAWLQSTAELFPVYWIGLGMRAAMLPEGMAAVELGGEWRLGQVFLVLGLWIAATLLLAVPLLKRMARKESGSALKD
ncbi:ABC transporter permease [Glycomyces paridis]|uniref:ABC transporter permease n=1 Tax=Glycomyces paridis TaxID=2126555 RepID=A0A4S8PHY4_9ACTN|nr:ABC transporter permease [Glycomyces paridis]THV30217.1 ABC transporter permease [Glycomyces paridis]